MTSKQSHPHALDREGNVWAVEQISYTKEEKCKNNIGANCVVCKEPLMLVKRNGKTHLQHKAGGAVECKGVDDENYSKDKKKIIESLIAIFSRGKTIIFSYSCENCQPLGDINKTLDLTNADDIKFKEEDNKEWVLKYKVNSEENEEHIAIVKDVTKIDNYTGRDKLYIHLYNITEEEIIKFDKFYKCGQSKCKSRDEYIKKYGLIDLTTSEDKKFEAFKKNREEYEITKKWLDKKKEADNFSDRSLCIICNEKVQEKGRHYCSANCIINSDRDKKHKYGPAKQKFTDEEVDKFTKRMKEEEEEAKKKEKEEKKAKMKEEEEKAKAAKMKEEEEKAKADKMKEEEEKAKADKMKEEEEKAKAAKMKEEEEKAKAPTLKAEEIKSLENYGVYERIKRLISDIPRSKMSISPYSKNQGVLFFQFRNLEREIIINRDDPLYSNFLKYHLESFQANYLESTPKS